MAYSDPKHRRMAFNKWYSDNRDEFNEKRRQKYADNEELRQKAIENAREYRKSRKAKTAAEVEPVRRCFDNGKSYMCYTVTDLSALCGVNTLTLKNWEKKDLIPYPDSGNVHRYYTEGQKDLVLEFAAWKKDNPMKKGEELTKRVDYIAANWNNHDG